MINVMPIDKLAELYERIISRYLDERGKNESN